MVLELPQGGLDRSGSVGQSQSRVQRPMKGARLPSTAM